MKIYHGSKSIIEKPIFGMGNPHNDYGLGFYCTADIELAKEWACTDNTVNGYANIYEMAIDECAGAGKSAYKILDLRKPPYTILNWIAVLLKFRTFDVNNPIAVEAKAYLSENFYTDVGNYDIVVGYRADDSYFSFARDFLNNTISLQQLGEAMELGELGTQIVLKSEKAFDTVEFAGYEIAESKEYYVRRASRDKKAREQYFNANRNAVVRNGIFVIDLMRKGVKNGDDIL